MQACLLSVFSLRTLPAAHFRLAYFHRTQHKQKLSVGASLKCLCRPAQLRCTPGHRGRLDGHAASLVSSDGQRIMPDNYAFQLTRIHHKTQREGSCTASLQNR